MAQQDPINQRVVEEFLAQARGATREQAAQVAERLEAMVRRGERAMGTNLATMAETARRLRTLT